MDDKEVERLVRESALYKELEQKVAELETAVLREKERSEDAVAHAAEAHKQQVEQLQAENQSLRNEYLIHRAQTGDKSAPKRPIDLFAEILELRARADSAFNAHDHLPRVVVVGDQSAGKTSVLEVIVRAHIFPRGLGEMMTRAPIQVTLKDGARHVAKFHGHKREYDLNSPTELAELRREIQQRMVASIATGEVVSTQPLSLEVTGPGLNPMVLVDLPGIIQHHTQGMSANTKGSIMEMCRSYIDNPSAIILCIQDATRDAEGSSVADIVRDADPNGQRTVFVLTKVDLAEQLRIPADKMRGILKGKRFNMKAKAYFAVVTGTANPNDSIEAIRHNEKRYFERSAFLRDGAFSLRQAGIDNLAKTVSDVFWERVKLSVSAEAKEVTLSLRRKENEWKNTYPNQPRHSRDDLFNLGRTRIVENMARSSSELTPARCEELISGHILDSTLEYFLKDIYLGSANTDMPTIFKTNAQNALDFWVTGDLPRLSIRVAKTAVLEQFNRALDIDDKEHTFAALAETIKRVTAQTLSSTKTSETKLEHIQEVALADDAIKSKRDWEDAISFMIATLTRARDESQARITRLLGPSTLQQWMYWQTLKPEQRLQRALFTELSSFFPSDKPLHAPALSGQEVTSVQHILKRRYNLDVDAKSIAESFKALHSMHFVDRAQASAAYCRGRFHVTNSNDNKAPNGLACADVALFWRYHNMLRQTANVLRIESMDYRHEVEESIRQQLDHIAQDPSEKQRLISGKKVALSEEIEILRIIHNKLDSFIKALQSDGSGSGSSAAGAAAS